jgi:hypothetical protein
MTEILFFSVFMSTCRMRVGVVPWGRSFPFIGASTRVILLISAKARLMRVLYISLLILFSSSPRISGHFGKLFDVKSIWERNGSWFRFFFFPLFSFLILFFFCFLIIKSLILTPAGALLLCGLDDSCTILGVCEGEISMKIFVFVFLFSPLIK